jgi:hypothetical protein
VPVTDRLRRNNARSGTAVRVPIGSLHSSGLASPQSRRDSFDRLRGVCDALLSERLLARTSWKKIRMVQLKEPATTG